MDHLAFMNTEMEMYNSLKADATHTVNFTNLLTYNTFSNTVENICSLIDVIYYKDYVKQIWNKWYKETVRLVRLPK